MSPCGLRLSVGQMGAVGSSRRWKVLEQWPGVSPKPGRFVLCQLGHLTTIRMKPHTCCQLPKPPCRTEENSFKRTRENCCHFKTGLGIDARPPAG